ncbi:MAG TPA: hypothetical protein PKI59_03825, partial [Candidatus Cloacimonadota bacterium]|nr:hypothetical protein [Candidatus Cloacimonadota bacterium]
LFSTFVAACKMDIKHEIWLNNNGSGKAKLNFFVNFPIFAGGEAMQYQLSSAFGDIAEEMRSSKGYNLLKHQTIIDTTESEINYNEVLEFKFADLDKLNHILKVADSDPIRLNKQKKITILSLNPPEFKLLNQEKQKENLTLFDIEAELKLHLPAKPKSIQGYEPSEQKGKLITWKWLLDEYWYVDMEENIVIEY